MRKLLILFCLAAATPVAHADTQSLCERDFPKQAAPSAKDAKTCAGYFAGWAANQAYNHDLLWQLTAAQLKSMADAISSGCKDATCGKAAAFLQDMAASHFDLIDRGTGQSFFDVMHDIMRGIPIQDEAVMNRSAVTLWIMRNAPYARHGHEFKHPDLNDFFYNKGSNKLPPLRIDPKFKDSMLTGADDANVKTVAGAQDSLDKDGSAGAQMGGGNPCGGGGMEGNPCGGGMGGNPCGEDSMGMENPDPGDPELNKLCFESFPAKKLPSTAETQKCAAYYVSSNLGSAVVWKLTAAELETLAKRVEACKGCPNARDGAAWLRRAGESHFSVMDPFTGQSIIAVLNQLLAGEKINPAAVQGVASVTLWRYRNAPYARHGRAFKSPDLQTFFYDAKVGPGLGLTPNPGFKDSMLDKNDELNVAAVMAEIRRRGEQ